MPKVAGECRGAEFRAIVKLYFVSVVRFSYLALFLQIRYRIDKCRAGLWFSDATRLLERNHVGGGLLDDAEAVVLQLADNGGFPSAGSAGHDKSFHKSVLSLIELSYFASWNVLKSTRL